MQVSPLQSLFFNPSFPYYILSSFYQRESLYIAYVPVKVLQETKSVYNGDLLWGINSHYYGGWNIPRSTVYKLETQENQLCNLVYLWRSETRLVEGVSASPKPRDDKMSQLNDAGKKGEFPSLQPSAAFRSSLGWMMPTHIVKGNRLCRIHQFSC